MIRVQFSSGHYLDMDADMEEINGAIRRMKAISESTLISEGTVIYMRNVDYILDLDSTKE